MTETTKTTAEDALAEEISSPRHYTEEGEVADRDASGPLVGGSERSTTGKRQICGLCIPARVVLGIVSFFGFFTNYMLRVSINIAIVSMVKGFDHRPHSGIANVTYTDGSQAIYEGTCIKKIPYNDITTNHTGQEFANSTDIRDEEEIFPWNSVDQGIILGSFYWSYVITLVPGAVLARQLGPKIVFGAANGLTALLSLLTPLAARSSFTFLITLRVLQGFASGTTWPAMHTMTSHWIPPHERSKFISTYLGNAVGTALTYPLCGFLIDSYGWPYAFYVPGCIALIWCVFWWIFAYDTPSVHPFISKEEQVYIEEAVSPSVNKTKVAIPWLDILKSIPFWALVIANLGSLWGFMTVLTYSPTYFKNVHGFNIQANGILSGLPNIMRFIGGVVISYITDRLVRAKSFSFTTIRKGTTLVAIFLPGLLYLLMTNVGCDAAAEIAILTVASALSGGTSAGPLANTVDLAPNFAGMLMGLVSLIAMCTGFVVPSIVGAITKNNNTTEGWRVVFIIAATVSLICSTVFTIFGSGEVQPWNGKGSENHNEDDDNEFSQKMKSDHEDLSNGVSIINELEEKNDKVQEKNL